MLSPRLKLLLQKEMTRKEFLRLGAITVASLVGAVGVITELLSHAATPYASNETESGTLGGGATLVSDAAASGGKTIQFGSGGANSPYAAAILALPSLALWLPLTDASGTIAIDHSSKGTNGTYSSSGVTYSVSDAAAATVSNDKAVSFGTTGTLTIPNVPALRLALTSNSAWTLSLRIMVPASNTGPSNNTGYPPLLALGDGGAASGFQLFYSYQYQTVGVHLGGTTAGAVSVSSLQSTMSTLTVTWNGSLLSYYQNGSLITTNAPGASASITDTSNPFIVGPNVTVDQVIIANSCASTATIASLYTDYTTSGLPVFTAQSPPAGIINQAYSYQFTASGVTPIAYTHTGTLPAGLTLSSAGLLSGTPTANGSSSFVIVASNSVGSKNSTAETVVIGAASTGTSLGFASATVWQDDNIRNGIDSSINPNNSAVAAVINKDAADMQAAGITWVRYWPSVSTPSTLAGIFQLFKNHGISMIYCYNFGTDASNESAVISNLQAIVPAVSAVGCHVWEIGNEMNLAGSPWTTNNPVGNYCTRLKDCYTTIKSLDSSSVVIAGGISYNPSYTADGSSTSDAWFSQFCSSANGMWNYCDGIGIHPYSDSNTDGVFSALSDTRNAINSASGGSNFANKPLCITELGWYWEPSDYYGNQHGGVSPANEVSRDSVWTATMNQLKANGINGGTFPVCYYTWYDGNGNTGYGVTTYTGPTSRNYSGLYAAMQSYTI